MVSHPDYLAACPLFVGVPLHAIKQDCPSVEIVSLPHGSVIYTQGQRLEEIFCVLDGCMLMNSAICCSAILLSGCVSLNYLTDVDSKWNEGWNALPLNARKCVS